MLYTMHSPGFIDKGVAANANELVPVHKLSATCPLTTRIMLATTLVKSVTAGDPQFAVKFTVTFAVSDAPTTAPPGANTLTRSF